METDRTYILNQKWIEYIFIFSQSTKILVFTSYHHFNQYFISNHERAFFYFRADIPTPCVQYPNHCPLSKSRLYQAIFISNYLYSIIVHMSIYTTLLYSEDCVIIFVQRSCAIWMSYYEINGKIRSVEVMASSSSSKIVKFGQE